jgi:hypothetical protein
MTELYLQNIKVIGVDYTTQKRLILKKTYALLENVDLYIGLDIVTYQGSPVTQQLNGASLLYSLISVTMKTNASS